MTQGNTNLHEGDERHATLIHNANAVRAICSSVEGTLGPKGLDVMLVGAQGEVIITNDGVTILERMDVSHPAARLLIQVARSQQREVGDGTTTATILAGALVQAGVSQVLRGVPAAKVVAGMQQGIRAVRDAFQHRARPIEGLIDPVLRHVVQIAGRGQSDIVELVMEAAHRVGIHKLHEEQFSLASHVIAFEKAASEVWSGLLLRQTPLQRHAVTEARKAHILVLQDALEPEQLDEELLTTEAGFQQYMELRASFLRQLESIVQLHVGLIVLERGIHPDAEQFCADHNIIVVQRVSREDIRRLNQATGAVPVKRFALHKTLDELHSLLGYSEWVQFDEQLDRLRIASDAIVTMIVGASTAEVVGERARIAADAASALQSAIRSGYLPGGGTTELAVSYELERAREALKGMESFGVAAVAEALRKPMSQIILNAGFNPLEKLEQARSAQVECSSDAMGIDCDSGGIIDYIEQGIIDPAFVKIHAIQAAGEVAAAILRIHTVIKMKSMD